MRTPYNDSGEHLEDDDSDDDEATLTDPDETGIDLLEETAMDEGGEQHVEAMEVDNGSNSNTSRKAARSPHHQPSKQIRKEISKEEAFRKFADMVDSSDDEDDIASILTRLRAQKQAKKLAASQQHQQQPRQRVNEDQSIDASHATKVIDNTSSSPPSSLPLKQTGNYSFEATQQWERELRAVESLEHNASPTPLHTAPNKRYSSVDTSFLESSQWHLPSQLPSQLTQSSEWQRKTRNSNTLTNNHRSSALKRDKETWQEEAFRSSLVDLLKTVPDDFWLRNTNKNDESQSSITSQQMASAQLQRQRCFDAAARSLARLAIASRHMSPKNGTKNKSSNSNCIHNDDNEDIRGRMEESPDFSPPTPRTLPSFMSVLNVIDSTGGNNDLLTKLNNSNEVFCGQSVHGCNARTVYLPNDNINNNTNKTKNSSRSKSSDLFDSWTLEQMAIGAMKVAAQVCHEAANDSNFDRCLENDETSYRVAGFIAQNAAPKSHNEAKYSVSAALLESSLEFLATSFACLESDVVFAVLRSPIHSKDMSNVVLVFDAIAKFAPRTSVTEVIDDSPPQNMSTIQMLALLTLSRGLEASRFVTRYATSLDPSSTCTSYTCPHSLGKEAYIGQKLNINVGVDEGGVGYLSAVGRDLGLFIESSKGWSRLKPCAEFAYDCILDFDPIIVDDGANSLYNNSAGHAVGHRRKADSLRLGLKVDTQVGRMASAYRCSSVVKDRIFSSTVEFLTSMIHFGIVSTWLSQTNNSIDVENADVRMVDKLCQKLFTVIETRARLRRSVNQSTKNECDNEAVCTSALSLLILCLPRHVEQITRPTPLSTSFRNIGDESSGTISDLLQSSMVKKIVDLALSWGEDTKEYRNYAKYHSSNNAILILSAVLMAGAGSLLQTHASEQLETFLQRVTERICNVGQTEGDQDYPYLASALSLLVHLHTDCPLLVRQFLRDYIGSNSSVGASFSGGLIFLCASKSFSVGSYASSLLRALIEGSPVDRTEDVLSESILSSFGSDFAFDAIEFCFCTVLQTLESSTQNKDHLLGLERVRWLPRLCSLSDMLDKCSYSINFYRCIQLSFDADDTDVLDLFVKFIDTDRTKGHLLIDALMDSTIMSLLTLFARFALKSIPFQNDDDRDSFSALQKTMADTLLGFKTFSYVEAAMLQGSSVDAVHRAVKFLYLMLSLHRNERHMASSFTKLTSSIKRKENESREKLVRSENDLMQITSRYKQLETDYDILTNSLHEQRTLYERKLDLVRADVQMKISTASHVHSQERKLAEARSLQYKRNLLAEQESRKSIEHDIERISEANERLKSELYRDKLRIQELEEMLDNERKSKKLSEFELEKRTNELALASEEMHKLSIASQEMQSKLAATEESVSHLTAIREDSEAKLEETCEKLIQLSVIFQSTEVDMTNNNAQLRIAHKKANQEAGTAYKLFKEEKKRSEALMKELDDIKIELDAVKTNKAQMQRMRTHAPVSYLNQMHDDSRLKQKTRRRSQRGKENSFDGERRF